MCIQASSQPRGTAVGAPRVMSPPAQPVPSLSPDGGVLWERVRPDERVSAMVKLQLQAEERGVVSIKGVSANRFLAMKEDGRLLALKCATEECFFFERLESNNYNTYRSRKYSDWYVALKRTGQYKPGPKTGPGQKAILFLPMSAKS
ncbi:fibroblast growth factor 2 isoform X1 [Gallus gallus]|uniref:Fibroblast growth factor n=1 Tax=Gallus gallus TaxID=9031 RepID=Q07659_CHICK|nr:fibroblast growth factor 2 isoform X1 [Gallus gallus]XP_046795897.1 fibroblast growth factor 2 isoform X1 [Gallus gallus]AAA48616.1 fibroblast growth factor [Gallus gallus]